MANFFDTHSHPHFAAYKEDSAEVITRALERGVRMVAVGTKFDTSQAAITCAEKYDGVWAAVGLHPIHLSTGYYDPNEDGQKLTPGFTRQGENFEYEAWKKLALSSPKVVAIGETGLDYYRLEGDVPTKAATIKLQQEIFKKQANLAAEIDKTLIVHCRQAHDDAFEIIKETKEAHQNLRVIIHCFTGTPAEGQRYLDIGCYLSFPGIITFAKDWDNFIPTISADKILVETDCPYLTPVPHRGERNEPAFVEYTIQHLAKLRGGGYEVMAEQTYQNALKAFAI
jgi:TatD DNase family protein